MRQDLENLCLRSFSSKPGHETALSNDPLARASCDLILQQAGYAEAEHNQDADAAK